ncbi:L-fuconolactonase [Spirosomataceae bacterium TFI 002]|nr:L-fuconolactonase [Spirosomataceae bacterium TFI 002]
MIDAHHHFWNYNSEDFAWIDESMTAIRRSFLPPDLSPILKENGIEGSVLIQVNRDEKENEIFLQFANQNDFVKGTVGWLDLTAPNLEEKLEKYANEPKLKGFREIAQGNSDKYFPSPSFRKGVELLGKKGFTYDILVFERDLKNTLDFVESLPNNKFVIDHIAKPDIKNGSIGRWSNYMKALAQYPNVSVKISGMTTEADWNNWKKEGFYIYLDHLMGAFGVNRLMYGSDWPVCLLAAKYAEQLAILKSYTKNLSTEEQRKIFHKNAVDFYGLD